MFESMTHVSVCICTFRRPTLLRRLLKGLEHQQTDGLFTYSIVVVDNDVEQSAEQVVAEFEGKFSAAISYCREPQQSIALARNRAVENTRGNFIAFIDDDEVPVDRWLVALWNARNKYDVDGVLGPVLPLFDEGTPQWVIDGRFYDRPTYPTGYVIDWRKGRTGNVLLKRDLLASQEQPFRPEFRTGEDQDLFRRLIAQGHKFVWCNEAVAYEAVPAVRWTRRFILRRAMLRGAIEPLQPTFASSDIARSIAATLLYSAALPVALLLGQGKFMMLLYKTTYHVGLLLAWLGIQPIKEAYVTT